MTETAFIKLSQKLIAELVRDLNTSKCSIMQWLTCLENLRSATNLIIAGSEAEVEKMAKSYGVL